MAVHLHGRLHEGAGNIPTYSCQFETGISDPKNIYYFDGGFKNIRHIMRVTPAVAYNLDRLTVAVEYNDLRGLR